jgi:hypothetical protein
MLSQQLATMKNKFSQLVLISAVLMSCGSDPKVIPVSEESSKSGSSTGIFSDENNAGGQGDGSMNMAPDKGIHTVKVKEVLPTTKYVYLLVEEDGEDYWVSTLKFEVNVGEIYFYREGLLKNNFHSTEHNRTFDKVYLVSQLVKADHAAGATGEVKSSEDNSAPVASKNVVVPGSVRISDLVANPKKYGDKEIQVSGVITKVNVNIMNRNWLHIKDGSKDDYDMVVTTDQSIPEGHTVTLKGKVSLNKDFGAGYKYQIIIEEGKLVN